jgi:hypothetical protein
MSRAEQNIGYDRFKLVVAGRRYSINWQIPNRLASTISTAQYILADKDPEQDATAAVLVTKTVGSGISLADVNGDVIAVITVDGDDTEGFDPGNYFHRLDYVTTDSAEEENGRGAVRITRRV